VAAKAEQLMRMRRRIEIVNLSGNWCEKKIVERVRNLVVKCRKSRNVQIYTLN
jgi:hypothetical protein